MARDRLLNGLFKLNETNSLVDGMKAELALLQPVLESKSKATAELLEQVSKDQEEAEEVKATVSVEEAEVKVGWGGGILLKYIGLVYILPYISSSPMFPQHPNDDGGCIPTGHGD